MCPTYKIQIIVVHEQLRDIAAEKPPSSAWTYRPEKQYKTHVQIQGRVTNDINESMKITMPKNSSLINYNSYYNQ